MGVRTGSARTIGRAAAARQSGKPIGFRKRALVLWAIATWLINGCATSPAERTGALAQRGGASVDRVLGAGFEHVVFSRNITANDTTLHIYFSGDGTPWIHRTQIAPDPTPRDPLELRLMLEDPAPSIYIGRPCYLGLAAAPGCKPALWSVGRYSEAVVDSMAAAVERVLDRSTATQIMLIGYSGGGVLAMLVANRVVRIGTVVTIAANLDTDAWTRLHDYSALSQSLNPAMIGSWREAMRQIHLVGEHDRNVPPTLVWNFASALPNAQVRVIPAFDHRCCWVDAWPTLLKTF